MGKLEYIDTYLLDSRLPLATPSLVRQRKPQVATRQAGSRIPVSSGLKRLTPAFPMRPKMRTQDQIQLVPATSQPIGAVRTAAASIRRNRILDSAYVVTALSVAALLWWTVL